MIARRFEALLWAAQRITAAILAALVVVHLATIIYAVRGGLTAAEILARTRSSIVWPAFYALFVFACAVHGAIGLRNVAGEWLGWRGRAADAAVLAVALALAALGLRAVAAVTMP